MADQATMTVQVDKDGRMVIPKSTRQVLGIDGEAAEVEAIVKTLPKHRLENAEPRTQDE